MDTLKKLLELAEVELCREDYPDTKYGVLMYDRGRYIGATLNADLDAALAEALELAEDWRSRHA